MYINVFRTLRKYFNYIFCNSGFGEGAQSCSDFLIYFQYFQFRFLLYKYLYIINIITTTFNLPSIQFGIIIITELVFTSGLVFFPSITEAGLYLYDVPTQLALSSAALQKRWPEMIQNDFNYLSSIAVVFCSRILFPVKRITNQCKVRFH